MPLATVEPILGLYRDRYFDLNVRHVLRSARAPADSAGADADDEKLREEHRIELSYTWVKAALQGAGLVKRDCPSKAAAGRQGFGVQGKWAAAPFPCFFVVEERIMVRSHS